MSNNSLYATSVEPEDEIVTTKTMNALYDMNMACDDELYSCMMIHKPHFKSKAHLKNVIN